MSTYTATELLQAMLGGKNGGVLVTSGVTTAAYDFMIVDAGVTFTVLTNELNTDLVAAKNISGHAFTNNMFIGAGVGHTFKAITFSGGDVWGYTLGGLQI